MVGLETSQLLQFFLWTNQDKLLSKVMCGGVMGVILKHLRESKHWNVHITQQYLDQGGSWNWCWLETTKMRLQREPKKCTCSTQKKERGKRNHSTCRRQVIKDVCELESTVSHVKSRSNNWPWGRPLPCSRVPFDHLRSNFSRQRCQWCTANEQQRAEYKSQRQHSKQLDWCTGAAIGLNIVQ